MIRIYSDEERKVRGKEQTDRWRTINHDKVREYRKRNYAIGRQGARNAGQRWTEEESLTVTDENRWWGTDRELAKILGRSVQAIQQRRLSMKKKDGK